MSAIVRTAFGVFFGVVCVVILQPGLVYFQNTSWHEAGISLLMESPSLDTFQTVSSDTSVVLALVIVAAVAALCLLASNMRRALGRGFLILGISFFAMPFSFMLLMERITSEMMTQAARGDQTLVAVGGGIATLLVTGLVTPVGIILGAIFTVTGLVLAR